MSWFLRGTQSAIFYYISCSPYYECVKRRKFEKERKQAKAEVEQNGEVSRTLQTETNPYWTEEIMMGPSRGKGKASQDNSKSDSTKRLDTGKTSSAGESSLSAFPSLEGVELDENWNRKRYQRPDEYLWGSDDMNGSYASLNSRAANRPLLSGDGAFYRASGPATTELHPPVLTKKPSHASQVLWMVQPPPAAKIMEGKERADRSRSVSNASCGTGGALAGRQASLRRPTKEHQDDLPADLASSPASDDDEEDYTDTPGQRPDRSSSDPYRLNGTLAPPPFHLFPADKKRRTRVAKRSSTRPALSTVHSEREAGRSGLQVPSSNPRSSSPAPSLLALQQLTPANARSEVRPSSALNYAQNEELPPTTDLEERYLAYEKAEQTSNEKIPAYRWSMDI